MRQPLYTRLRPFLRRDLRARLVSALLSVAVLTGLTWLGISALTGLDSLEAHHLRMQLGMESASQVCGSSSYLSDCNYDDHAQERVDREFYRLRGVRVSVLTELDRRIQMATGQLDDADRLVDEMEFDPRTGHLQGDTVALREALNESVIDLAPTDAMSVEIRRERLLGAFERVDRIPVANNRAPRRHARRGMTALVNGKQVDVHQDPTQAQWMDDELGTAVRRFRADKSDIREHLKSFVQAERDELQRVQRRVRRLLRRDDARNYAAHDEGAQADRVELVEQLTPRADIQHDDFMRRVEVATWLAVRAHVDWADNNAAYDRNSAIINNPAIALVSGAMPQVDLDLARAAKYELEMVHTAISDGAADIWQDGWTDDGAARASIIKPMVRYRSPISNGTRWQLFGVVSFLLAGIMLVVVGPVVTATSTAREREAGTLPVLRMTGLSAGDLALAMAVGPNVFALVAGGSLLLLSLPVLALTVGPTAVFLPLGLLLVLGTATHLTAIGLGDALGQRVNAMVVGGLLGLAVLGPGLIGSVMVVGDMATTGLLLGPLPATVAETVRLSGLPYANLLEHSDMGLTMLGYTVAVQALLGGLCLLSWRRRVEQAWAPLFRPFEGAALALASVGCSALAVLDLSERVHVQTYDTVNLITFVSTAFLMPVLGWLLVSSLVRPARASAVASSTETRRAFMRFQAFVLLTGVALAGAYWLVLDGTHLRAEKSEVMWATLTQGLLVAQTAVATLLLASRRREGKHRVFILGTAVALCQLAFAIAVYNLEVEHVAFTQKAGLPFMIGMDASPYWVAFLVVLWAAGLGLVLAALLRERGREDDSTWVPEESREGQGDKGSRWLH